MGDSEKEHHTENEPELSFNKEELQRRKDEFLNTLSKKKSYLVYLALAVIMYVGYWIRTLNVALLQNKLPVELDSFAFLRYAQYILEHGKLMAVDYMRYYPWGFSAMDEFKFLSYFMVYLYKFLHMFIPSMTLDKAVMLYPPIAFAVGIIFFFLLIRKLFNWKVAIMASALLTVIPAYLYRTIAGFSDKEAFAMTALFVTFYILVSAWQSKKSTMKCLGLAALAGLANGIMGIVWGGVTYTFFIIGLFIIIQILINKFDKKDFYLYSIWFAALITTLFTGYPARFNAISFLTSTTTQILTLAMAVALTHYLFVQINLFKLKDKIQKKMPVGIFSLVFPIVAALLLFPMIWGPSFFIDKAGDVYVHLVEPFGTTRWALTVAESHQPYFTDWVGQMNWTFIILMFGGITIMFYELIKPVKRKALTFTAMFLIVILGICMSRYSPASKVFNGISKLSLLFYIGSMAAFFAILIYSYIKSYKENKDVFERLKEIDLSLLFVVLWFFFMEIAARGAIRLLFPFTPIACIAAAYCLDKSFEYSKKYIKQDLLKIGAYIFIVLVLGSFFIGSGSFMTQTINQAKYTGPAYNSQWQQGMDWVRGNTPENAVFAHWWDYGYWVQGGGRRATLSDGGNAVGGINHFIGRHVLTGHSDIEALEYMKARNATHLLMIKDEVGKYPAFSSIGGDKNYDRYSWIPTFALDKNQIMETRNSTVYLYTGGTPVDHDIVYNGQLFPANSAGIGGFFVKVQNMEVDGPNGTKQTVQRFDVPEMALFYNGIQTRAPVNCIYINEQKILFNNPNAINACLRIIPTIEGQGQMTPIGALLYLSPEVAQTNLARYF
ncbi:MAG: STT3 domain-containing protein, partial [Candidatus Woesearchaeota archaeon]